jgi:hypothetical protein
MKHLALLAALSLTGCATCEHHPIGCSAAVAVIGTSIALSANHSPSYTEEQRRPFYTLNGAR